MPIHKSFKNIIAEREKKDKKFAQEFRKAKNKDAIFVALDNSIRRARI